LKAGRDKNGYFKYRALRHKLDSPQSPVIDKICCFCEGKDGTLWLGSNGYGLYKRIIDQQTGKETFQVLTTDDGLANNSVKGIVEDQQGHLWITTNNGLSIYDPSTNSFRNYGEQDGLASSSFYWNSAIKGADETIYLGSVNGITEIKGENSEAKIPSHLTFTGLFVNNQPVMAGSDIIDANISRTNCINLHESDKSFAIEFSSLTYGSETQGYYSYRLKGFEKEWTALRPGEHSVRYTSLKPGNYTLEVRYIADSNTDEEDTISIDIHVAPYFWKSWWFILLAVIALGILFWQLYRLRLEAWRKQQAEKLLLPIKKVLEESDAPEHLQKRIQNILDNQERIQKSRHRSIETDKQQMQHIKGFMERATDILEHHYMDYQFDLTAFADAMGMSKSLLSKRIKQETGVGPNQFIRNYRLSIARDLILENYANRNITEIAYKVGFNDPKYFTRCFTHLYGTSPSTYK
jgi:AraC-like DNA-binding protein